MGKSALDTTPGHERQHQQALQPLFNSALCLPCCTACHLIAARWVRPKQGTKERIATGRRLLEYLQTPSYLAWL